MEVDVTRQEVKARPCVSTEFTGEDLYSCTLCENISQLNAN